MSTTTDNRVQLLGHLGQDVELREFAKGNKLARLSLATNEFKKSQNGPGQNVTTWHNLVAWGQTAETMSETLRKGQKVFVEGKITYRQYETKSGEKRSSTEIVVSNFKKMERDQKAA
jgi:single-strand DNA-binding protein